MPRRPPLHHRSGGYQPSAFATSAAAAAIALRLLGPAWPAPSSRACHSHHHHPSAPPEEPLHHVTLLLPFLAPPSPPGYPSSCRKEAGRQQPGGGPSLGSPVTASNEVVPAEHFAKVYEAVQDEKWNGAFGKANHSNSTLKTSKETSSLCVCVCLCVKMGVYCFSLFGRLFSHLEITSCFLPERLINTSNYRHSI